MRCSVLEVCKRCVDVEGRHSVVPSCSVARSVSMVLLTVESRRLTYTRGVLINEGVLIRRYCRMHEWIYQWMYEWWVYERKVYSEVDV